MTTTTRPQRLFSALVLICIASLLGIVVVPKQLTKSAQKVSDQEAASLLPPKQSIALAPIVQRDYNGSRHCTSPEFSISFPLQGRTAPSATSSLHCGTHKVNPFSHFFRMLSSQLQRQYKEKCKDAVRFGVAFGRSYTKKLSARQQSPHKCAFTFVLEHEMPKKQPNNTLIKSFGWETLVPIPQEKLPYKSMRRNVKLFKLHGHELFPFASLLIWQDTKLKTKIYPSQVQFFKKFMRTPFGVSPCMTVIGLPKSAHTLGSGSALDEDYRPKYQHHCDTVVNSIESRPHVTDSADTLLYQCQQYQQQQSLLLDRVSLDRGLIDSAFIVWNQRTSQCRDFNAKLACTWSDEIQCHSDRDQVSFPYVLQKMDIQESNLTQNSNVLKQSLFMVNRENGELMVQVLKSSCHWYFKKFPFSCPFKASNTKLNVTGNNITTG